MPEERLIRRRLPALEKRVSEIQPDSDVRVRLTGTVIDSSANSIVLDDGSGKIEIYFEDQPKVKNGQMIRIITTKEKSILPLS